MKIRTVTVALVLLLVCTALLPTLCRRGTISYPTSRIGLREVKARVGRLLAPIQSLVYRAQASSFSLGTPKTLIVTLMEKTANIARFGPQASTVIVPGRTNTWALKETRTTTHLQP